MHARKIEDEDWRKQELHYGGNAKTAYNSLFAHRRLGLRQMSGLMPPSPSRSAGGVMSAIRPLRKEAHVGVNKPERMKL